MRFLPFEYAVRNLGRSSLRLSLSIAGSLLVVVLVIAATSFVRGMSQSLLASGSPENVIFLGAGSEESVERSEIKASVPGLAKASIPNIKHRLGIDYVSPEIHMAAPLTTSRGEKTNNMTLIRGVTHTALAVHKQVRIIAGRLPNPGANELMIGRLTSTRLGVPESQLALGKTLWFDNRPWSIVGHFEAPGTVMEAEVWLPLYDLMTTAKRTTLSCVVLTLDNADFSSADAFAKTRLDLELVAVRESDYYGKLSAFYQPVRAMVWVTAILIALGGLFGGLNTMYAAFATRIREIGMLQSLGFPRRAVVLSFIQESVLAASTGALLGSLIAIALFDNVAVRFSKGAFGLSVDATTIAVGLLAGLLLGLIGALPPAWRCVRLPIAETLKSI